MPLPINEELRDFVLRRQHYIARFQNGTIAELVQPYQQAKQTILKAIIDLEDYGSGYTLQFRLV